MPTPLLFIFIDGLGWPPGPLEESPYRDCPALRRLLEQHAVPLETGQGVPGLPQSASNQASFMTGRNIPAEFGHLEGFPTAALRSLLEEDNLLLRLVRAGRTVRFANAYVKYPNGSMPALLRSVTTVTTLSALGGEGTLGRDELLQGRAVTHDLTRDWLRHDPETAGIPTISEAQAAADLLRTAEGCDLCMFEYFLTDRAGHRGTDEERQAVLASLDRFLAALLAFPGREQWLILLTSDHGNIEEFSHRRHTANPVPWIAIGPDEEQARQGMSVIRDVHDRILQLAGV